MPEFWVWLLAVFATYRVAKMVATEEGPFSIFYRLQQALGGFDLGENGEPVSMWGRMITCPHCVGVYAALFFTVLVVTNTWLGFFVIAWLGIAGVQSFIQEIQDAL